MLKRKRGSYKPIDGWAKSGTFEAAGFSEAKSLQAEIRTTGPKVPVNSHQELRQSGGLVGLSTQKSKLGRKAVGRRVCLWGMWIGAVKNVFVAGVAKSRQLALLKMWLLVEENNRATTTRMASPNLYHLLKLSAFLFERYSFGLNTGILECLKSLKFLVMIDSHCDSRAV